MNITRKPIRKCNGCELNFKRYCGVYETPRLMWERGKCQGYNNEEMLLKYKTSLNNMAAKEEAKRKRQEIQALRKTESHHAGHQHTLVASDSPSDRKKSAALHANYLATPKHTIRAAGSPAIGPPIRARRAAHQPVRLW